MKTVLLVVGVLLILWANGWLDSINASDTTTAPTQPVVVPSECYDRVHASVKDEWADMTPMERAAIGIRAISVCEGGGIAP